MQKIVTQISKIYAVKMVIAFSVLMLELMIINAVLGCYSGDTEYCVSFNQVMGID